MKKNVWLLAVCQATLNTGNILLVATSALVSLKLAPDKALATLPLAVQFLASMITTMPASMLMRRIGRQAGFLIGTGAGLAGAGLAAFAIVQGSFVLFSLAAALFGVYNGFGTYYRFAAADAATPDYRPAAISYVMAGGVNYNGVWAGMGVPISPLDGHKNPFHIVCIKCHKDGKKGPSKCMECHKK